MERKLWMRLGVSLRITPAEEPDGDSYIPGVTVEEYNLEHGTNYEVGDTEFDL